MADLSRKARLSEAAPFLEQLVVASTKISVAEGEKKTQSLRIKR